jgi:hypothetical protein
VIDQLQGRLDELLGVGKVGVNLEGGVIRPTGVDKEEARFLGGPEPMDA